MLWIIGAIGWLVRRNDALPLVVSGFLFYGFGFRLWALLEGLATPVLLTPFGFKELEYPSALDAFGLALLGQTVLLGIYMFRQRVSFVKFRLRLENAQGAWLRSVVLLLVIFCIPLVFLSRYYIAKQSEAGLTIAFQVSNYAFLFPFVLNSIAILLVTLWKAKQLPGPVLKIAALVLLVFIAWLSFGSSGRFLFLGWMLASIFIVITGLSTFQRLFILAGGIAATLALFGVAGALRSEDSVSVVGLQQTAWDRVFSAEDANMLDGFVFIRQVYPSMLSYSYGGEHFGILLRPIPRALWPGKPLGGYMNQLGLTDAESGFTLGISPSLFGDFYQEGSWMGIILFSVFYGWLLARLVTYSSTIHSFAGISIRVILYAFMIPLLRGGDLPGIYAWLGMAFWPHFVLFWLRRRDWVVRAKVIRSRLRLAPKTLTLATKADRLNASATTQQSGREASA